MLDRMADEDRPGQPSPLPEPELSTADEPRTGGISATPAPVRVALALLVFFFALLGLWLIWPLITGS